MSDQIEKVSQQKSSLPEISITSVPTKIQNTVFEDESTYSLKNPYSNPTYQETAKKEKIQPKARPTSKKGKSKFLASFFVLVLFITFWFLVYFVTKDLTNSSSIFSRNLEGFKSWEASPPPEN